MSIRILVADDDREDYLIIKDLLSDFKSRYLVEWESDLENIVSRILKNDYDIYIIDYLLGPHSGLEIVKEARRLNSDAIIVLVTGNRNDQIDTEAIQIGADDLLIKREFSATSLDRSLRYAVDRKRQRKLLEAQNKQVASIAKMASLGEVTGGIAHEIINPISVILGRISQMRDCLSANETDKNELKDCIDSIEKVTDRISNIVTSLKNFINTGVRKPEYVSLKKVFDETRILCSKKFRNADIELQLDCPKDDQRVYGIASEIEQILFILLNNAFDAVGSSSTERVVSVSVKTDDPFLEISVMDSGSGISLDVRDKIFHPFFSTKGPGGSGLGLSVARRLAESHKGSLFLDQDAKKTTFVVRLPIKPVAEIARPILIVDDEEGIIKILTDACAERNIQTIVAHNGEEGLRIISSQDLRAVITDLRMPILDGLGMLKEMKKLGKSTSLPVFVMSGFQDQADLSSEVQTIRGFYEKPFNVRTILDEILAAC